MPSVKNRFHAFGFLMIAIFTVAHKAAADHGALTETSFLTLAPGSSRVEPLPSPKVISEDAFRAFSYETHRQYHVHLMTVPRPFEHSANESLLAGLLFSRKRLSIPNLTCVEEHRKRGEVKHYEFSANVVIDWPNDVKSPSLTIIELTNRVDRWDRTFHAGARNARFPLIEWVSAGNDHEATQMGVNTDDGNQDYAVRVADRDRIAFCR